MAVTTAKIRAREKETGKTAKIGMDSAGNLHYAFDTPTLDSILAKANAQIDSVTSARAKKDAQDLADHNNQLSQLNQESANRFNAQQAQLNREFQADMSNTAHQREVADLKAAGLNPVLSAGGSGASSPSGSTASGSAAGVDMGATAAAVEMAKATISAKTQLQMNRDNINSAQQINNKSLALQKELGLLGFDNAITQALIAQATGMYTANRSYEASKYAVDNPNTLEGELIKNGLTGGAGLAGSAKAIGSVFNLLKPNPKKLLKKLKSGSSGK